MARARTVIADDVIAAMSLLAVEWRDASIEAILVGLGLAPDEADRFLMVGLWSAERVIESLEREDDAGILEARHVAAAAWLDGFAIGVSTARREAASGL